MFAVTNWLGGLIVSYNYVLYKIASYLHYVWYKIAIYLKFYTRYRFIITMLGTGQRASGSNPRLDNATAAGTGHQCPDHDRNLLAQH